ncbi:NAD(P) transhydrogenase subunit alpha [Wenzhouxiangella sp. AB-CW3]|uniref:NAD(P) transhydrogenase subunit alpha n=1 Tax=Wenzhouxiangella sp. AB-CW3 TaxID=2771012 RepID=UPI00168B8FB7|nr:NAD(P) transhydrogenase subunit alpha [Wenzhouxiangella sp. AB-CW3]QOC21716.1 NAD(P) transhydrogenase subunit alpha [Wenzhouxiangella sp. AB-CW3]
MTLKIGIVKETASGERRVALDPPTAAKLTQAGHQVLVESGAGSESGHPDESWGDCEIVAGATDVASRADVLLSVRRPEPEILKAAGSGTVVIGQLVPYQDFDPLRQAADDGLSLIAMELVPRITRAQAMDVLSSQATIAGYKAVIIAADIAPRLFPMLTTAAGTLRPAKAVVIGAGVAGLQAIATARRLGAQVEAYDIRAAAREQVESLGAKMIDTGVDAETEGGYARELTDEEREQQAEALARHLAKADVVVSTAAIPGRSAPKIITSAMVDDMAPGSVIVDLAAETGGNCELTRPGETVNHKGVLINGPTNLPSRAPLHASEMYAKNIHNLLALLIDEEGELKVDTEDEVIAGCLLAHDGQVVHEKFK